MKQSSTMHAVQTQSPNFNRVHTTSNDEETIKLIEVDELLSHAGGGFPIRPSLIGLMALLSEQLGQRSSIANHSYLNPTNLPDLSSSV